MNTGPLQTLYNIRLLELIGISPYMQRAKSPPHERKNARQFLKADTWSLNF